MSITLSPKPPVASAAIEIVINGRAIGELVFTEYRQWHAAIKLGSFLGLIQGFGDTQENAIAAAIKRGRDDANQLLRLIDEFEKRL